MKIDAGFVVSATLGGDSVASLDDDVTLDIFGIVVSDANFSGHGVNFSNNGGNITNELGAVITGSTGVFVDGNVENINNLGSIFGLTDEGVLFGGGANNTIIINHRLISGITFHPPQPAYKRLHELDRLLRVLLDGCDKLVIGSGNAFSIGYGLDVQGRLPRSYR